MTVREEVEKIKEEMCHTRCKWLDKANKVDFKTLEELTKVTEQMQQICENCPLTRL